MASGSEKSQEDAKIIESVGLLREREESNAAAAAAAAAPPPVAPQSEIEEVDGPPPEAGDRDPSMAAEREGEETMSLFRRGSAGGKPPLPPCPSPVSGARGPSSVGGKPHLPLPPRPPHPPCRMSYEEVLASGMAVRDKWKSDMENRFDLKDVFDQLMLPYQRERSVEMGQKAEAEGMPRQQNEQEKSLEVWPKKDKKPLWRKKIHITELIRHYNFLEMFARQKELVLDRQDTYDENRLLARLGCTSDFSRSHKPELMLETVTKSEIHQKADLEEMPGQLKEQSIFLPPQKTDEGTASGVKTAGTRARKICHRRIFLIAILILFGYLPTLTGFQTIDPADALTDMLMEPEYQMLIQEYLVQIQQAQDAQEAARNKVLWRTAAVVLFLSFLFGNLMAGPNDGPEEPNALEAPAPEIGRGPDMLIAVMILIALFIIIVAIRTVLRGQL